MFRTEDPQETHLHGGDRAITAPPSSSSSSSSVCLSVCRPGGLTFSLILSPSVFWSEDIRPSLCCWKLISGKSGWTWSRQQQTFSFDLNPGVQKSKKGPKSYCRCQLTISATTPAASVSCSAPTLLGLA